MPGRESPLKAIRIARSAQILPDGTPIPSPLKHALLVLVTYWPNVFPGQTRLAADMGVDVRTVNRRLKALESAGLLKRKRRGFQMTTYYTLDMNTLRRCDADVISSNDASGPGVLTPVSYKDQISTSYEEAGMEDELPF